ncbi:hypothetical protein [Anatilimnocola floriformis]|uniref:hypothetical protein n=1 Tax=Anatilimnocola floriformis TaxID=2948575 RepID=UPI0020C59DC1|nr:hypothetical protein [Anatilimnocola floriformis]
MPIDVTCGKCHTRFQVSEKYAGKKGPCPKCKTIITVPTLSEQVVVHAPEMSGPKDSKGQSVLKPISRTETKLSRPMIIGIVGSIVLVLIVSLVLRVVFKNGSTPLLLQILGAFLLAPPLSYAAYHFLRNDEFAPFSRQELLLRLIAPSLVYPAIWGLYWYVMAYLMDAFQVSPTNGFLFVFAIPVVVVIGAFCANASLDLEFGQGAIHYCVFLVTTIILRGMLGMNPYWNAPETTKPKLPPKGQPKKVVMVEEPYRVLAELRTKAT